MLYERSIYKVSSIYMTMQIRVQAIRGLPLFCKDTPENIGKIVDILVQILASGKLLLRDVVLFNLFKRKKKKKEKEKKKL